MRILIIGKRLDGMGNLRNEIRVAKALKQLGYDVQRVGPNKAPMECSGYDLIVGFGQLLYKDNLHLVPKIAHSKDPKTLFAIWSFDSCSEIDEPSRYLNRKIKSILPHIDWLITTDHSYPWEHHAKRYLHLMQGIDPDEFDYEPSNNHDRKFDLIYAGGIWGRYQERNQTIKKLARNFKMVIHCFDKHRFDGFKNITFKDRVYGKAFFDAHQQAKIVYVPRPPSRVNLNYWSNRIYLAGATGTPCIVEFVAGIEEEFNENEAIYSNCDIDTIHKIFYFLDHPEERQAIGLNARKKILEKYTYKHRAKTLMETIFS